MFFEFFEKGLQIMNLLKCLRRASVTILNCCVDNLLGCGWSNIVFNKKVDNTFPHLRHGTLGQQSSLYLLFNWTKAQQIIDFIWNFQICGLIQSKTLERFFLNFNKFYSTLKLFPTSKEPTLNGNKSKFRPYQKWPTMPFCSTSFVVVSLRFWPSWHWFHSTSHCSSHHGSIAKWNECCMSEGSDLG